MKTYYVDAAKHGKMFIVGYCDTLLEERQIKTLPFCHKSHEAEIEAVKYLIAAKIETIRILSDSQAAVDYFRSNPADNTIVEKIPRSSNLANQILSAFKESKRTTL